MNADGYVLLPGQVAFLTRISFDLSSGSSDQWVASSEPADWTSYGTGQHDTANRQGDITDFSAGLLAKLDDFDFFLTYLDPALTSILQVSTSYLQYSTTLAHYTYSFVAPSFAIDYTVGSALQTFQLEAVLNEDASLCDWADYSADIWFSITT